MSLLDELDRCTHDLQAAQAAVNDHLARQKTLSNQVLAMLCPFQEGDEVPLSETRYLRVHRGGRTLFQGGDGRWSWRVEGTAYDTHTGQAEMVGDNFRCRRTFFLSGADYAALPDPVRASTPASMLAAAQAKLEAKASQSLQLGPHERAVLGLFPTGFLSGNARVRLPLDSEAQDGLTPFLRRQALRRLVSKHVIDVPLAGKLDLSAHETMRMKTDMLSRLPDIVPGKRAAEAQALLVASAPPGVSARRSARAPRP